MLFIYGLGLLLAGMCITDLICHLDAFILLQGILRLLKRRTASLHTENLIYIVSAQGCKCLRRNVEEKELERATKLFLEYIMSSGFFSSQTLTANINSSLFPFSIQRNHVDSGQYEADGNNE